MEVDITAKNISLLPSNAACLTGKPSRFLKNIFSYYNAIVYYQPLASTMASKVKILIVNLPGNYKKC